MANKKTRAVNSDELELIVSTIRKGFVLPTGEKVRPNERIAACVLVECNLGIRIGDILQLRLSDIVYEGNKYRINIVEQKTQKSRHFIVSNEIYIFLQNYAISMGIKPNQRLFALSARTVQNHIQLVCKYLGLSGVSTHSFRKYFAQTLYEANSYDLSLIKEILQHSSLLVTERYLGVSSQTVENALKNHVVLLS